jgi:HEPN domain-containing protein
MPASFEQRLGHVRGKIYRVNMADRFDQMRDGLLYYWNRAEQFHSGAQIIRGANGPFQPVALLAGLSIELLLKGIYRAFDEPIPHHHRLHDLCRDVGITVSDDDQIILEALSEHVYWASRYPVLTAPEVMPKAMAIFDKQRHESGDLGNLGISERDINQNYDRLWSLFATYYHQAREARIENAEFHF